MCVCVDHFLRSAEKAAYLQHELDELRTATDENLADEVTRRVADADSGR